ncbi:ring-cleaving dioxygenase [Psychrobacillus vulpis]|uniref:Ring-cleaving dioxygenase n=1 Tax=Psychrobacillus vulpis TaxID=2325572 RepID=A0A544TQD6_9BACI|nr:ring-cleaving dioxygenase [Psychrobacillus vulpis]TQR19649.1 ring-cleaving dioxygenase [Psychrobacillus vulpis]
MNTIKGHHHVSMVTKNAQTNVNFYRETLGLRLVKKTVNQDTPSMYHLFYGDETGSPGTELSFFELPIAARTHRGTNSISRIGLLVQNEETLTYWQQRFLLLDVKHGDLFTYGGRLALPFEDPDGLQLLLISNEAKETPTFWTPWEGSPVPIQHQILGIGPVELTVRNIAKTGNMLTNLLGYHEIQEGVFQSVEGAAYSEIVLKSLQGDLERPGRGSVHHIAIRVDTEEHMKEWAERIGNAGFESTGVIDRYYFHSLYFRESNGILFELATDGPGFSADEANENLGKELALPPFLENRRAEIEAKLKPII